MEFETKQNAAFAALLGAVFLGTIAITSDNPFSSPEPTLPYLRTPAIEGFASTDFNDLGDVENFTAKKGKAKKAAAAAQGKPQNFYQNKKGANGVISNKNYMSPEQDANSNPITNINLDNSGNQLLSFQLYQQAVNAATPTKNQLESISGQSQEQTGSGAIAEGGGLSADTAPYNVFGNSSPNLYDAEFQAVNFASNRAERVSACAQNAPTFVATSLLPKPNIPGQETWDINAPDNILANQNFLSSTQQVGVDTVLGSLRNPSYDIRNNIPNPINVVSPWLNTTILPDLERRPLDCFLPSTGLYGCGPSGCNVDGTFVGKGTDGANK